MITMVVLRWVVVVVAVLLEVVVGFLYLVSGLAVPGLVVLGLLAFWVVQVIALVHLVRTGRHWWTPLVPVVGGLSWYGLVLLGDSVFGWTA